MALRKITGQGYRRGCSHPTGFNYVIDLSLNEEVAYRNDREALKGLVQNRFPMLESVDCATIVAAQPGDKTEIF